MSTKKLMDDIRPSLQRTEAVLGEILQISGQQHLASPETQEWSEIYFRSSEAASHLAQVKAALKITQPCYMPQTLRFRAPRKSVVRHAISRTIFLRVLLFTLMLMRRILTRQRLTIARTAIKTASYRYFSRVKKLRATEASTVRNVRMITNSKLYPTG